MSPTNTNSLHLPSITSLRASICKDSLKEFIKFAWPLVEPSTPLVWNWHLDVICDHLERVTKGEIKNLIINIPPGFSKSLTVSVLWPAWEWARDPSLRYLTASYSDVLTIRDNRRLRSILTSDLYKEHFPHVTLSTDQSAKVRFDTTAKGSRIASSVKGAGTGEHPDRIIIDDPHKAKEADRIDPDIPSFAEVWDWYKGTISTRKFRDPATVIVMQRLHLADLAGHLLSGPNAKSWVHLCLPMRYEPQGSWDCPCHAHGPDPNDIRTKPGELLWPEIWGEDKTQQLERDLAEFGAAGQLQQRPVPISGGLFKRSWFEIIDSVPAGARYCRGWDTAATIGAGDWTAGIKIAEYKGVYYVCHASRFRAEDVSEAILSTAELDGRKCAVRELREPAAAGKAIIKLRSKLLVGYNYEEVSASGSKVSLAKPFASQAQAGNVKIVRDPMGDNSWIQPYIDELCVFPFGSFDDQVDGSSCAFNSLVADKPKLTSATWGTGKLARSRGY